MARTADDAGRVKAPAGASGNSLPPELAQLIAAQAGGVPGGGLPGIYLDISLNGKPGTKQVRLEGKGWRDVETGNGKRFSTLEEAVNSFYLLDDKYREDIQKQMWFLGLIDGPNNLAQALKVWGGAVEMSWNFKAAGKDASPMDMLRKMTNLKAGQLGEGPLKAGVSRSTTQRQINFTDPAEAKAWIREAFQASMGRDPHDAEIRSMLGAIAKGNKSSPQVITTTVDPEGNTTQQVMDPGFNPQAYIQNQMAEDPEGAAYQAAATLYPALMQALQSP